MSSGRKQYPFHLIEPKWQRRWEREQTFRAWNPGEVLPDDHPFSRRHGLSGKVAVHQLPPKFYILDMFPYPSGAGLHVGHPEGYTATDILARYRRAGGFNVLHPMGWDAFGLPAEQYAIKTGQHPRKTTEQNIATFKRQIQALGFSYDWSREVDTTDPEYFRWTQWIFLQLYDSWFNPDTRRAEPIATLKYPPELQPPARPAGEVHPGATEGAEVGPAEPGVGADLEARRRAYRDGKRLAYVTEAPVWWCEQLGTVLANEEVIDGKSEVGGFAVVRRPMRQWMLRITAYAERLLADLDTIDWSPSLKEMQRNWLGRSEGAEIDFPIAEPGLRESGSCGPIRVFTTRPDTLFGATYMVLAPEHKLVEAITTTGQRAAVEAYRAQVAKKSDLERTELAKEKTGVFTGAYATNPANGQRIPVWIADYVLASYGTGAIMGVPGHDTRDFEFAQRFVLPIVQVVEPPAGTDWRGYVGEGISVNSASAECSLNGLPTAEAKQKITAWLESKGFGQGTVNYKLRDWLFSRQRYWGEPFPIVWKRDALGNRYHAAVPEPELPVLPPALDDYKPTPDGQPPLARAREWVQLPDGSQRETNTMPQWAGSCWYYLRYLDPANRARFTDSSAESYWMGGGRAAASEAAIGAPLGRSDDDRRQAVPGQHLPRVKRPTAGVDLYVGGTEHAVLHLLYARFWHKVLFDLGHVSTPEPFCTLVNQGLILGEDGQKMSKSRGNVVNPDDILAAYGADAFRLYEMFMGPLEMVKPWSTKGVEGVYRFLGRVWRLFVDEQSETEFEQTLTVTEPARQTVLLDRIRLAASITESAPGPAQLKTLHATIKKVTEDLDGCRFNTAIAVLMMFINQAMTWETKPVSILREFLILLQPFAPHLAEELWSKVHSPRPTVRSPASGIATAGEAALDFGHWTVDSLAYAPWPVFDPALLVEDTVEIPVQVNGKLRAVITVPATATAQEIQTAALAHEKVKPFLAGKTIRKVIVVSGKVVNIAVA